MVKSKPVRARPLLDYVLALAIVIALPLVALVVAVTWRWVESEQVRLRSTTGEIADHASAQVDSFLAGQIASLQALATSPSIDAGDFDALDRQARSVLTLQGANIVLRAPDGRQLVNTRLPRGRELPLVPNVEADTHVLASKSAYISDIFTSVVSGVPLVRFIVPVIRDGEVRYTVSANLPLATFGQLLRESGVEPPYFGSVSDRTGRIIARASPDEDALVGTKLPGFEQATGNTGEWTGVNPRGVEVYAHYHRSKRSGWLVAVAIEKALLGAPLWRSLRDLLLLAVCVTAAILLLSSWIARRIIRAQRHVQAAAQAVVLGETTVPPLTPVRETNLIGEALAEASVRLRDQANALLVANRDLERRVADRTRQVSDQAELIRATLDNMDQGLMLIDQDGSVPICNQRALELLDLPASLMLSRPKFTDVLRYQLEQQDFARSDELLRQWVESGGLENSLHSYERERPNGLVLEIRTVPLERGGAVRTYTDITVRKHSERLSEYMARHDGLTGLPNRTLAMERLAQALAGIGRQGGCFALLSLDLDRFKAVNDTLGHPTGDALLREMAARIQAIVAPNDLVARLGGDEFAILQMASDQPVAARELAERIIEVGRKPFELGGSTISIGVSIGVAIAPSDGLDVDAIFKCSDLALYRSKASGRNAYRFYEAEMDTIVQARQSLELDLRKALVRGEMELEFHPVMNLADEAVCGFEALMRWQHPVRGVVMPSEFVPIAEETRLIIPLGTWALNRACRAAADWPAHIRILVNVSGLHVEDPAFLANVTAAVTSSGLRPERLQLEITETVLMRESETVLQTLQALRDFGVRVALDDFGTGHSSLNYLRQFPLDAVKIDRTFVTTVEDTKAAAILSAIASLGLGFGMSVTAVGVETPEQLAFVRQAGCTEAQGYLFGRPVDAEAATRLARGYGRAA